MDFYYFIWLNNIYMRESFIDCFFSAAFFLSACAVSWCASRDGLYHSFAIEWNSYYVKLVGLSASHNRFMLHTYRAPDSLVRL